MPRNSPQTFPKAGLQLLATSLLISVTLPQSLLGHDFWIEPPSFRVDPDTVLALYLRVGEDFQGEAFHRSSTHIRSFFLAGPEEVRDVPGLEGMNPAGYARIRATGLFTVTYESNQSFVEMQAQPFEDYLAEEGLERIVRLRAERGESHAPGREAYSRCAKALIWAGGAQPSRAQPRAQMPHLELEVEENPNLLQPGAVLPIRLLYVGSPLADALVTAIPKDAPDRRISARTDAEGRVRLKLDQSGSWLVKSVHMVPSSEREKADWESFWASLTFELRGETLARD